MDTRFMMYPHTVPSISGHNPHTPPDHPPEHSVHDPSWPTSLSAAPTTTTTSTSSSQTSHLYLSNQPADRLDFVSSPTTSAPFTMNVHPNHHGSYATPQLSPDNSHVHMGSLPNHFNQVEGSIGPDRIMTRRARAAFERNGSTNRKSSSSLPPSRQASPSRASLYPSTLGHPSRPHTPNSIAEPLLFPSPADDRLSVNISGARSNSLQSPRFPTTPASSSSSFSGYHYFTRHSRSNSSATNPRSASPALSATSALTSVSSGKSAPNSQSFQPFPPPPMNHMSPLAEVRPKQRKQRLFNVDRKAICLFHKENPNARQEDIAIRYGVERSTISKILKFKQKWLNVPEHEDMRIAKHRPSKFPEIEEQLVKWLVETQNTNTMLTDALIRSKAKDVAKSLHVPEDKFKASSGWVENFKHRHGIRGGVWKGDGKNTRAARALGLGGNLDTDGTEGSALSPLNPAFDGSAELGMMDDTASMYGDDFSVDVDAGNEAVMEQEARVTMQPPWPQSPSIITSSHNYSVDHLQTPSGDPGPLPPVSSLTRSDMRPPASHPGSHQLEVAASQGSTHVADYPNLHSATAANEDGAMFTYENVPHVSENTSPTIAEAEQSINTLIYFLDTTGQHIITTEEREHLNQIKRALFQAASGIPYQRPSK